MSKKSKRRKRKLAAWGEWLKQVLADTLSAILAGLTIAAVLHWLGW